MTQRTIQYSKGDILARRELHRTEAALAVHNGNASAIAWHVLREALWDLVFDRYPYGFVVPFVEGLDDDQLTQRELIRTGDIIGKFFED